MKTTIQLVQYKDINMQESNSALYFIYQEIDKLHASRSEADVIAGRKLINVADKLKSLQFTRHQLLRSTTAKFRSQICYTRMQPTMHRLYDESSVTGYHLKQVASFDDGLPPDIVPICAIVELPNKAKIYFAGVFAVEVPIDYMRNIIHSATEV